VSSPLNLAPNTHPLPKFKEHLPKFLGNNTITTNEHLVEFPDAFHNIGSNDNDMCMRLFVNSLEGKVVADFFDLPPKILSVWVELVYWFIGLCNCLEVNSILASGNVLEMNMEHVILWCSYKTMDKRVFVSIWKNRSDMLDLN